MPISTDKLYVNQKELVLVRSTDTIPANGGIPLLTLEEHQKLSRYLRDRQTWVAVADAEAGGIGTDMGGLYGEMVITVNVTTVDLGKALGEKSNNTKVNGGTIDWGDGSPVVEFGNGDGTTNDKFKHTYTSGSEAKITITGRIRWATNPLRQHLRRIELPTGESPIYDLGNDAFVEAGINNISENLLYHCESVTSFEGCFRMCGQLSSVPSGLFSRCTSATSFARCFSMHEYPTYGTGLTAVPADLFKNCTRATDFSECFYYVHFKEIPADLFKTCTQATNFKSCFYDNNAITSIPSTLFDNCPYATTFESCFSSCDKLTSCPTLWSKFPYANGSKCFNGCYAASNFVTAVSQGWAEMNVKSMTFNQLPTIKLTLVSGVSSPTWSSWLKFTTTNANAYGVKVFACDTDAEFEAIKNQASPSGAYYYIDQKTSSNSTTTSSSMPSGTYPTGSGTKKLLFLSGYFVWGNSSPSSSDGRKMIESIEMLDSTNISPIVGLCVGAFKDCTKLKAITHKLFSNIKSGTTFAEAFSGCTGLTEIPSDLFSYVSAANIYSFQKTFYNCSGITTALPALWSNYSSSIPHTDCFTGCSKALNYLNAQWEGWAGGATREQIIAKMPRMQLEIDTTGGTPTSGGYASFDFDGCFNYIVNPYYDGLRYVEVDWGDGSEHTILSYAKVTPGIHTWPREGKYTMTIIGNVEWMHWQPYLMLTKITIPSGFMSPIRVLGQGDGMHGPFEAILLRAGTIALKTIPANLFDNLDPYAQNIGSFAGCFRNCTSLTSIPDGLFAKCPEIFASNFEECFANCTGLKSIPSNLFPKFKISDKIIRLDRCFSGCVNVTGKLPEVWNEYSSLELGYIDREDCFTSCTKADNYEIAQYFKFAGGTPRQMTIALDRSAATTIPDFRSHFGRGNGLVDFYPDELLGDSSPEGQSYGVYQYIDDSGFVMDDYDGIQSALKQQASTASQLLIVVVGAIRIGNFDKLDVHVENDLREYILSITTNNSPIISVAKGAFAEADKLVTVASNLFAHCTGSVNFSNMFKGCTHLQFAPKLWEDKDLNVSNSTDCFYGCVGATNYLEIPYTWGGPARMILTFRYCGVNGITLKLPISSQLPYAVNWNFAEPDFFDEDVSSPVPSAVYKYGWDTDHAIAIIGPVTWDRSLITDEEFKTIQDYLTGVTLNYSPNTASATFKSGAFEGCTDLEEFNVEPTEGDYDYGWSGIFHILDPNVKTVDVSRMFKGCTELTRAYGFSLLDTKLESVNMSEMFSGCTRLTEARCVYYRDDSDRVKGFVALPSTVKQFNCTGMFKDCTKLDTIPTVKDKFVNGAPANATFTSCFENCSSLTAIPELWKYYTKATGTDCFRGCEQALDYQYEIGSPVPDNWGGDSETPEMKLLVSTDSNRVIEFGDLRGTFDKNAPDIEGCIDWGDGSPETTFASGDGKSDSKFSHTYSSSGNKTITIKGHIYWCRTYNTLLQIVIPRRKQSPIVGISRYAFDGAQFTTVPGNLLENCRSGSIEACFHHCDKLLQVPEELFKQCTFATNIAYCFSGCYALKTVPENLFESLTNVITAYDVFHGYDSPAKYGSGLTTIPPKLFQAFTKVTTFSGCFDNCDNITSIPATLFSNCKNVTDFSYCFSSCNNLTSIPPTLFSNCKNVTKFNDCFSHCTNLTSIPVTLFSNCSNATGFEYCFSHCFRITSIPATLFSNCKKVTNFRGCFAGCIRVTGAVPSLWITYASIKYYNYCYTYCYKANNYNTIPAEWKSIPDGWPKEIPDDW